MKRYLDYLAGREQELIECLRQLVEAESPSGDVQAAQNAALLLQNWLESYAKAQVRLIENPQYGPHLCAEWGHGAEQILLVGHYDTVHPLGTLRQNPCRLAEGRLYGPGIYDMKAGLMQAIFALAALNEVGSGLNKKVVCFFNADEELGSPHSRILLRQLAAQSKCAYVLEPSTGLDGALKIARRGVGTYRLTARGKAAHAGNNPEEGVSAIEEICRQVLYLQGLTDPDRGIYLNCGLINGGSAKNTIPDWAETVLDLRLTLTEDAASLDALIKGLQPYHPQAQLTVEGGISRPPMVQSPQSAALFRLAQELMAPYGGLTGRAVGGASDGNLISDLTPTLDGLGAVGAGAHALDEYIKISELVLRTALLAALIEN